MIPISCADLSALPCLACFLLTGQGEEQCGMAPDQRGLTPRHRPGSLGSKVVDQARVRRDHESKAVRIPGDVLYGPR